MLQLPASNSESTEIASGLGERLECLSGDDVFMHLVIAGEGELLCGGHRWRVERGDALLTTQPSSVLSDLLIPRPSLISLRLGDEADCAMYVPWLLSHVRQPLQVLDMRSAPLLSSALHELQDDQLGWRAFATALLKQCFVLLLRDVAAHASHSPPNQVTDARIARALHAIEHDPGQPHSVARLAKLAGMSRSAFAQRFVSCVHMKPMRFVKRTRLRYAAGLLECTQLPIKCIAIQAGFLSRSHFSRAFRQAYLVNPTAFRLKPDAH